MTTSVQNFLASFDAMSPEEQHEATVAFLRKVSDDSYGDFPDEALIEAGEALFLELDAREARDGAA